MGRQNSGIFILMRVLGKKHPETRTQPTVGTPEQGMIVGEGRHRRIDDVLSGSGCIERDQMQR